MNSGQEFANNLARAEFVDGIQERKQITHGDGFDLHVRQPLHRGANLGFRQGFDDLTGVINPLGHAETPPPRDDLIWGREANIKSGLFIVTADLNGVAKAGGGNQAGGSTGVFQHGVGCDRCPVDHHRYLAEKIPLGQTVGVGQFSDAAQHAQGLVVRGGQDFLGLRLAGLVRAHEVGESPSDINA